MYMGGIGGMPGSIIGMGGIPGMGGIGGMPMRGLYMGAGGLGACSAP